MEIKQVNVKQGLYLFADTERCIHHGQVSIPVITLLKLLLLLHLIGTYVIGAL